MTLNTSSVTYDASNAPRDPKELAMIGRFRLKDLAVRIGLGDTPEKRSALSNQEKESLANDVAAQLARIDAASAATAGAPQPQPQVAPPPAEPQPAQEAAQEAPKRTPRGRAPALPPAATAAPAQPAPAAAAALGELQDMVKQLGSSIAALQDEFKGVHRVLAQHGAGLSELGETQRLAITLSLFFAEEVLGGDRQTILNTAMESLPQVVAMLGKDGRGGK